MDPTIRQPSISRTSNRRSDERVTIRWENIRFETMVKDAEKSTVLAPVYKKKQILRGLNGSASSGQLLAILGPTGCGKTSLLNVLAGRVPDGGQSFHALSGDIYMNGKRRDEGKFRKISAYVMQVRYAQNLVYGSSISTMLSCAAIHMSRTTTCSHT